MCNDEISESLERLETKISYQEHMIQQLNEVVITQQSQIIQLEKAVKNFHAHVLANGNQRGHAEPDAPPPHY